MVGAAKIRVRKLLSTSLRSLELDSLWRPAVFSEVSRVPQTKTDSCFWLLSLVFNITIFNTYVRHYRLRWSRGSVLAFGTQVRGFKPGRSCRIFKGEKIFSTPSFGGEVKPSVPCRRFVACKISLELRGSRILRRNLSEHFSPTKSSTFHVVGHEGT
jgi:hypothetical protein